MPHLVKLSGFAFKWTNLIRHQCLSSPVWLASRKTFALLTANIRTVALGAVWAVRRLFNYKQRNGWSLSALKPDGKCLPQSQLRKFHVVCFSIASLPCLFEKRIAELICEERLKTISYLLEKVFNVLESFQEIVNTVSGSTA